MPGRTHNDRRCEKSAKEPWLLATSMSANAQTVVDIYSFRMQIEQNYRDTKNHRWGWALDQRRSRSYERIEVLLLMRRLHRSPSSPLARRRAKGTPVFVSGEHHPQSASLVPLRPRPPSAQTCRQNLLTRSDIQQGFDHLGRKIRSLCRSRLVTEFVGIRRCPVSFLKPVQAGGEPCSAPNVSLLSNQELPARAGRSPCERRGVPNAPLHRIAMRLFRSALALRNVIPTRSRARRACNTR